MENEFIKMNKTRMSSSSLTKQIAKACKKIKNQEN